MTLPAAFTGWESLFRVGLWGISVPGNILVCPSIVVGLCFCSDREATPPAVTLPHKICISCISSPFCCFSTLTGSSKVEEQNINNICTQHTWKISQTQHVLLLFGGMGFFFLQELWRDEEAGLNFYTLENAGENLKTWDSCLRGLESQHCRNIHVGGALGGL